MPLRASIGLKTKTDLTYKGPKAKKPAGSFAIGFKGKSVAANWIKPWLKPSVWRKIPAKKNAPAEGRFLGRPMGAKPRPVI